MGDNFIPRSFRNHYKKRETEKIEHYVKKQYEYDAHCSSRWSSTNTNMLLRIRNSLVTALNKNKSGTLPRYIIVVLDNDLITYLDFKHEGVVTLLGSWVEWLVKEFTDVIQVRLDQLPSKTKIFKPFFYWVTAPTHGSFSRERNAL